VGFEIARHPHENTCCGTHFIASASRVMTAHSQIDERRARTRPAFLRRERDHTTSAASLSRPAPLTDRRLPSGGGNTCKIWRPRDGRPRAESR
jgi:hypothetical protein